MADSIGIHHRVHRGEQLRFELGLLRLSDSSHIAPLGAHVLRRGV